MNERAKRYIRGDGRNPYGSRGGYVTSYDPRHRRDRGEHDEPYMDNRYERDTGHHYREYAEKPYAQMRGNFEYDRYYDEYDCDNGDDYGDDMRDYRGGRRMDGNDYRGRARNAMGQYTSRGCRRDRGMDYGDYGDDEYKLSKKEMKEWEEDLVNDDGSKGAHFDKEMIDQKSMQMGIDPKEFGEGVLCMTVNMLYSDYCGIAKKFGVDRIEFYIEMAKAFLKDKDFDGDGAEKLYLYYTFIASK